MSAVIKAPFPTPEVQGSPYIQRYPALHVRGYRADFSRDLRLKPAIYHAIISREDSPEILVLSQGRDLKTLVSQARAEINGLKKRERLNRGLREDSSGSSLLGLFGSQVSIQVRSMRSRAIHR